MKIPFLFLLLICLICGLMFLPSCGDLKSMGPIRAKLTTDQGSLGYDSKSGLQVEVDARSTK